MKTLNCGSLAKRKRKRNKGRRIVVRECCRWYFFGLGAAEVSAYKLRSAFFLVHHIQIIGDKYVIGKIECGFINL